MKGNGMVLVPPCAVDRAFAAPERDLDYVLDRRDALASMLKTLPARHERAVRYFYFTDFAQEDIAWHLGASQEGARQILDEAEVMLRSAANVRFPDLCVNGGGR